VATLVGSTGFVGGHIAQAHQFDVHVHRPNVSIIEGAHTNLLVCAGLPSEKWRANKYPEADWGNMVDLAQILATVHADRAVLISTIDVYQPAVDVDERDPPDYNGQEAYGFHRAWFETFFQSHFRGALVIRLPALFAADVRKNLIHDLLHGKEDQWAHVNPASTFQFFDATETWSIIEMAWSAGINLLNVASEPVTAQQVASLFGVTLTAQTPQVEYNMQSVHADQLGGKDGYIFTAQSVLDEIVALRDQGDIG